MAFGDIIDLEVDARMANCNRTESASPLHCQTQCSQLAKDFFVGSGGGREWLEHSIVGCLLALSVAVMSSGKGANSQELPAREVPGPLVSGPCWNLK